MPPLLDSTDTPVASSTLSRPVIQSQRAPNRAASNSPCFTPAALSLASLHIVVCGCSGIIDLGRDTPTSAIAAPESAPEPEPLDAGRGEPTQAIEAGSPLDEPSFLDAGDETVANPLPVDASNPIVIVNDHPVDNWFGEYALLMASTGRINLAGIVVNTSGYWPDLAVNQMLWQELIDAARASGLQNVPDLVVGASPALVAPADEDVDATVPNGSMGARFIVETAKTLGTPELPLVVVNGGPLTDIADAYLIDPTIADSLVAVSAIGQGSLDGSSVGGPNGELDTWASTIVTQRLRFVQVSAYYEQGDDVSEARATQLPANAFGDWMNDTRTEILQAFAADQVALLSVALPGFATEVSKVGYAGRDAQGQPALTFQEDGCCWFVSMGDGTLAADLLWQMLEDPNTFAQ